MNFRRARNYVPAQLRAKNDFKFHVYKLGVRGKRNASGKAFVFQDFAGLLPPFLNGRILSFRLDHFHRNLAKGNDLNASGLDYANRLAARAKNDVVFSANWKKAVVNDIAGIRKKGRAFFTGQKGRDSFRPKKALGLKAKNAVKL